LFALGTRKLYQWISLMLIKDVQDVENAEIIKLSLIRGKLMSLLADELGRKDKVTGYFFAGIFSFIDILLNRPMEDILTELPLSDGVKDALLGADNDMRQMLDYLLAFEKAEWSKVERLSAAYGIGMGRFMELYVDALKWANTLDY